MFAGWSTSKDQRSIIDMQSILNELPRVKLYHDLSWWSSFFCIACDCPTRYLRKRVSIIWLEAWIDLKRERKREGGGSPYRWGIHLLDGSVVERREVEIWRGRRERRRKGRRREEEERRREVWRKKEGKYRRNGLDDFWMSLFLLQSINSFIHFIVLLHYSFLYFPFPSRVDYL